MSRADTPSLQLYSDSLSPELKAFGQHMRGAVRVAGMAMRTELIAHFRKKNAKPNKLGGTKTNYWAAAANSVTTATQSGNRVMCTVTQQGVTLHVLGGVVRPRRAKWLTIPVHPAAHGRSVKSFSDVKFLPGRVLVNGQTFYVLKKSATIPKDPLALPADEVVLAAIHRSLEVLARKF